LLVVQSIHVLTYAARHRRIACMHAVPTALAAKHRSRARHTLVTVSQRGDHPESGVDSRHGPLHPSASASFTVHSATAFTVHSATARRSQAVAGHARDVRFRLARGVGVACGDDSRACSQPAVPSQSAPEVRAPPDRFSICPPFPTAGVQERRTCGGRSSARSAIASHFRCTRSLRRAC